MRLRFLAAAALVLTAGCSEPPYKEMHQAQGALDAARAAGAETFAAAEFRDAQQALDQTQQAVTQRDYRLALRYALEARERAQEAARAAADHKAEARGHAERALGAAENALRNAEARLAAARVARRRARDLAPLVRAIETMQETLQKARSAMEREAYLDVPRLLESAQTRLTEALTALAARPTPRPARRRR